MTKKEMQQIVAKNLKDRLPCDKHWEIQCLCVTKDNNHKMDAISVSCNNMAAMLIYVDDVYEQYDQGTPLDNILTNIVQRLLEGMPQYVSDTAKNIFDFTTVKDKIFASLVNTQMNTSRLSEMPHRNIEDLSLIYRVLVDSGDEHQATLSINDRMLREWGVTEDELYELAINNTKRLLPINVRGMFTALKETAELISGEDVACFSDHSKEDMYVISNTQGIRGAIYMFDADALAEIAERLDTNRLYIFPSSIHEVIVCNFYLLSPGEANAMVATINDEVVRKEEVLSAHAYLFDKTTMTVTSL